MAENQKFQASSSTDTAVAFGIPHEIRLDARKPAAEWENAAPLQFSRDWRGQNSDSARQTAVQLLWSSTTLYIRFVCRYRDLFIFEGAEPNGRRDHLWDRDVAEVFLQPDPSRDRFYKEFEVSPNGMWIDLDIFPEGRRDLQSGLGHSTWLDPEHHVWTAELAIPLKSLTSAFDPSAVWRANFYRVEGRSEPRFYSAWRATNTDVPNFHVPARFGNLHFR